MGLEATDHTAQHADCRFLVRLKHLNKLETPGQRRILLDMALVFAPGRCCDCPEFATRQSRLQDVGGIALPGLPAGADQAMRLVDEQDDRFRRGLHGCDNAVQAPFIFTLHASACL